MTNCIFCRIASGEIPATVVHQDDQVVAFRDLNPQAPTHVLVVPRRHIATLNDVTGADAQLIGQMYLVAKAVAAADGIAERGYRTIFNCNADAGQTEFHLHLHVLGGRVMDWPPG
jgi:histidine triad (HIT) family protein